MSTPEDDLKALLREHAQTVVPRGDGLATIRERVARRRRRRIVLLPCALLAATASLVAVAVLSNGSGLPTSLEQDQPADRPTSQPSPYSSPTPGPAATEVPPPGLRYTGPAVWPFATADQARAWRPGGAFPWAENSLEVTRHFLSDHLRLTGLTAVQTCVSCGAVELRTGQGRKVAEVSLAHHDLPGGKRVFTVVSVDGGDLTVTRPAPGAALTSPTSVTGRITGVDENVQLQLVTLAGGQVALAGAPAGLAVPWQAALTWSDTSWSRAAVVGTTRSPKDGSLTRLVVVPVARADGATASGASFVGLADGHVALFDSRSGATVKQLTFPPAGRTDTGATWSAGTLAWVRSSPTGCADELDRLDAGMASTVVTAGTVRISGPQLSPSGALLAWRQQPCADGSPVSVVVRGGGRDRVLAAPSGMSADVLDVREDGALLVHLNDLAATDAGTIGVVPAGATSFDGSVPLTPTGSCYLAGAAAFDGSAPVAWETCGSDSRLVRFSASGGGRASAGPLVQGLAAPGGTTVRDGAVLLQRGVDQVARYAAGSLTTVGRGIRAPDW